MRIPFYSTIFHKKSKPSTSLIAQNVPAEVIHHIFAPFATTLRTNNLTAFPWFLGHICSTWRSIFRSMTPEFWSGIIISFDNDDDGCRDFQRPLKRSGPIKCVVQFFLERDPTASLSFALVGVQPISWQQDQDNMDQIVKMLIDESMRWKDVSFQCRYLNLTRFVRAKDRLPLLQKLHLMMTNAENAKLSAVFATALCLNVIKLDTLGNWKFVWSNLKDIALVYTDSTFYNALPHMTNLERLRVRYEGIRFKHSAAIISLPKLTSLQCDPGLLQAIKAPLLKDFTIDCNYIFQPPVVLSFLRRSSCHILYLKIRSAEAATAVRIIQDTSQITRLSLVDVHHVERALEQLTISTISDREPLARHLISLHIRVSYVTDGIVSEENMETLYRLIVSRTGDYAGCERLQRLGIFGLSESDALATKLIVLCKECKVEYVQDNA